jgi:uncharacterized protein (TIGR02421 family)
VSAVEAMARALRKIKVHKQAAEVEIVYTRKRSPAGLGPLIPPAQVREFGCFVIGLEVKPIYRHPETGELFPILMRTLRRGLSRALKRVFFEFARTQTTHRPQNYQVLGRQAVVKAVWEVDRRLAEIDDAFDFLLQVTPVNVQLAWMEFRRQRFERLPEFHYRPLPVDPARLKGRLYQIHLDKIEDPTLAYLFDQKRLELDRKLTMLLDRDTPKFLYGSLQVFGEVNDSLLQLALALLENISPRSRDGPGKGSFNAAAFAERARAEVEYYRQIHPVMAATVQVRHDITGLMVSQGNLLISARSKIPASRVEALIQHEVGTHILTYYNGCAQPFQQLHAGMPGYESLQEGLAVLAEYLVGGLSRPRLRLLAARVLAVRRLVEGASFIETFRELNRVYGFAQRTAYTITMRVYRGGGLTKDAVYLAGLVRVLDYLKKGDQLEPLFIGKITADEIPLIRELQWRQVLRPAPLRPRYMDCAQTTERLTLIRGGLTVLDLISRRKR